MQIFSLAFLILGLASLDILVGGTRAVFSLPGYAFLSIASVGALFAFRRSLIPTNIACLAGVGLFFGYVLVRTLLSPVEYLAREDLLLLLAAGAVYLMIAIQFTSPKYRIALWCTLLGIGLLHVGIAAYQYFRGELATPGIARPIGYGVRGSGFFGCPNHLAGFLEPLAMFAFALALWSRRPVWFKIIMGYAGAMCLVGILLTGSRGGYLSTLAGLTLLGLLTVLTFLKSNHPRLWLVLTIVSLAAAVSGSLLVRNLSQHYAFKSRVERAPDDSSTRFAMWGAALQQFQLNPVFGVGAGTYQIYGRLFRSPEIAADPVYAHNDYVQFLAEFGSVGMALFALFLTVHIRNGWKSFRYIINERSSGLGRIQSDALALNIGALSGLAAYIAHSVVDFNMHIPANALIIAGLFGILATPGIKLPAAENRFHNTSRYTLAAIPALAVWLLLAAIRYFPAEYSAEIARASLRDGDYQKTVAAAEKGIKADPTNPLLYRYAGQASYELGELAQEPEEKNARFEKAVGHFTRALWRFPQDNWSTLGLASALDALKRFDDAEKVFQAGLIHDPNWVTLRNHYALHLRRAGKLDEAEAQFRISNQLHYNAAADVGLRDLAEFRAKTAAQKSPATATDL